MEGEYSGEYEHNYAYGCYQERENDMRQDEYEEYRDLRGRKHVDVGGHRDRLFVMNIHPSSDFARFEPDGSSSYSVFRDYLKTHIPQQLLRDQYGDIRPIEDISDSQIATFQARLWRELPRGLAGISPPKLEDITVDDQLVAESIELIADTLECKAAISARSVFIY